MKLGNYLKKENIYISDSSRDTSHFYGDFSQFLKERGIISDSRKVKRLFVKRESIQSTGIGKGVATPHIFSSEFSDFFLALAVIRQGMDFKAPDGNSVLRHLPDHERRPRHRPAFEDPGPYRPSHQQRRYRLQPEERPRRRRSLRPDPGERKGHSPLNREPPFPPAKSPGQASWRLTATRGCTIIRAMDTIKK